MTVEPQVSVIVPTYREADNLPILIRRIAAAVRKAQLTYEIIIVDDNSQDGTAEICGQLMQLFCLRLITRQAERGLATAVQCGLQEARGQTLIVMDADLSHPPEKIPALVSAVNDEPTDFVIGSRYVNGGSVDRTWSRFRHLNSQLATWLARGLTDCRDPMAGFFAIRRSTLKRARVLRPLGYKIGLELIVRCGCRHVVEVPIDFADRAHGESKLTLGQQLLYMRHLGRLYAAKCLSWGIPAKTPRKASKMPIEHRYRQSA